MNKSAQHSAILIAAYIVAALVNYAFGVMSSWFLSQAQFGVLGVAQSLLLLTGLVMGSGFAWTAAHDMAASEPGAETRYRFRSAWLANTIAGLLLSGGLWVAYVIGWLPFGPAYRVVVPLVALTTVMLAARTVINGAARGLYRFGPVAINHVSEAAVKTVIGFALVALGAGVTGVMIGFALGAAVTLVHSLWIIKPAHLWRGRGWFDLRVVTATLSIFVGMLGPALMLNLDILGLKLLSPSAQGDQLAGLYQAAVILARTPVFVAQALTLVLFSYVAGTRNPARSDRREVSSYIRTALQTWTMLLLPGALVLIVAPDAVLALFFPAHYQAAASALQVAATGYVLLALVTLLSGILQAAGNRRRPALAATAGMIAQVALMVWLVPHWGTTGAALSLLIASTVSWVALLPAFRPSHDLESNLLQAGVPLAALAVPLVLMPDGGRGLAMLKLGSAGLTYLAVLIGLRLRPANGSGFSPAYLFAQFKQVVRRGQS